MRQYHSCQFLAAILAFFFMLVHATSIKANEGTQDYVEMFTISSGDVVQDFSYHEYRNIVDGREFLITFGGNKVSIGTNASNRGRCNLGSFPKYIVPPITDISVATVFACETRLEDVVKISYSIGGGNNQGNTRAYLLYSPDNETFSKIELNEGEQGANLASASDFAFDSTSGFFAVLFESTASGVWRMDNVSLTFYTPQSSVSDDGIIRFSDANVKAICVANWDTDGDGELSKEEAAAVSSIGKVFANNEEIKFFDEFKYFINATADGAFMYCTSLKKVTLPESMERIPSKMFYHAKVDTLVIQKNVGSLSYNAFGYAVIEKLIIEDGNETLNVWSSHDDPFGAFRYASIGTAVIGRKLQNQSMVSEPNRQYAHPFGQAQVGKAIITRDIDITDLFNGCKLAYVELPYELTSIGPKAFMYKSNYYDYNYSYVNFFDETELSSVTIPQNVISIGEEAFYGCWLREVIVENNTPVTITTNTFSNIKNRTTLYVPQGSKEAYENADVWKDFKEIVEYGEPELEKCATPTITYDCGHLHFESATEVARFISSVSTADVQTDSEGSDINLSATYMVTVRAVAEGYADSDPVTATIAWGDSGLQVENITIADTRDMKGDVNNDSSVDVADIATIISIMAAKARVQRKIEE